jgi:hypothetical protein
MPELKAAAVLVAETALMVSLIMATTLAAQLRQMEAVANAVAVAVTNTDLGPMAVFALFGVQAEPSHRQTQGICNA